MSFFYPYLTFEYEIFNIINEFKSFKYYYLKKNIKNLYLKIKIFNSIIFILNF